MDFSSDTSAPAHPNVIAAIAAANGGMAGSYGADDVTAQLGKRLADTFETDDFAFWVCASGTASNALALSCFCPPTGSILCHEEAHIERDERGAPEFFSGGGKLSLLPGDHGRVDDAALRAALAAIHRDFVHETPPSVLSLTNLTECGTAYLPEVIAHFATLAHAADLSVHMDGARLANALVSTGASPADMTWRSGVDVLTLGLTKTGAIGCEIILLFGEAKARYPGLLARAKRSGHMPPKMRFLAAQGDALLAESLWLKLAGQANRQALKLADALCGADASVRLAYPVEGNEVFAVLPEQIVARLSQAGAKFYPWPGGSHRFVCAWTVEDDAIDQVAAALSRD